jgi:hypothetical protein
MARSRPGAEETAVRGEANCLFRPGWPSSRVLAADSARCNQGPLPLKHSVARRESVEHDVNRAQSPGSKANRKERVMIHTPLVAVLVRRAALVLLVVAPGVFTVTAQQLPRHADPIEVPLAAYVANLRTVQVTLGSGTIPFLLDTGGGFTVLTPEVAHAAGCVAFGRVTGFRSSGERLDMGRCGPVSMKLGPVMVRTEAAILDLMALLKGAPPIGGVVSLQTLQDGAFTLDLASNRLVIESRRSLAKRITKMPQIAIRTSRQAGGAALDLFLEIGTPNGSIWLELDSGNAGPVLLSPHALTQLGLSASEEQPRHVPLNIPGLGPTLLEIARKDLIYDGLLNAAFLESIVLTVDLPSQRAWAARRR